MGYKTGRVKLVASPDELGEIRLDDGGMMIPYGVDDINEGSLKKLRKRGLVKEDQVSFRVSKDGFAFDIQPSTVRPLRRYRGKSI